jgi:diacylglycerol O-acyltransferase / trehalose O-mycolyltransferase
MTYRVSTPPSDLCFWACVFVAAVIGVASTPGAVSAAPMVAAVVEHRAIGPQRDDLLISSPAMGRTVPISVLHPQGRRSRGTVYLLDGGGRKGEVSDWINEAGADRFFADKNVNVVLPAGQGAFYTDWQRTDPAFGRPRWETFLAVELPPLIDRLYRGNGHNAIAGVSMGGQAAFTLATRRPRAYTGVGSISGCPPTTGIDNESQIRAVLARDGGNATNMWGDWGAPGWSDHDPGRRLDALRGKQIVITAGSGVPSPLDRTTRLDPGRNRLEKIATGAVLEAGVNACSRDFAARMRTAGLTPTEYFRDVGTHAWPYWSADLALVYRALARGL